MAKRDTDNPDGPFFPSREDILAFIAEHPGKAGKREIARAFGITGGAKIALKRLLRELEAEGMLAREGKRLKRPGDLPNVLVVDILGRDRDGDFYGMPNNWDSEQDGPAPRLVLLPARGRRGAPTPGLGDRILARIAKSYEADGAYKAGIRVIKILERQPKTQLGIYRAHAKGPGVIELVDKKGRDNELPVSHLVDTSELTDGDLVTIDIRKRGRYNIPEALIQERVGAVSSEKAISLIALHQYGIPHDFPHAVLADADDLALANMDHREDWRELPLLTIDPPDAKDHDDAVHAVFDSAPDNEGGVIVTVAIADVSWYVRPGGLIDKEALKRGNSVYFPDRVVPMLPERLSTDLCSLKEMVDRPALAVRMVFNAEGTKVRHSFHRIMMRSAASLSYAQAQNAFMGKPDDQTKPLVDAVLQPLWEAYAIVKRGRDKRAPLELDLPERKLILREDGAVDRVIVPDRLEAHKLIEEFMIQANVAAAETLEEKRSPLIYRIHDAPSVEKMEGLRDFLRSMDIRIPKGGTLQPMHFNKVLVQTETSEHKDLVHQVVLRSQSQAEYSPANLGHFGLNLRRYAHFTSPIRRYADLIVHRALVASLSLGAGGLPDDSIASLDIIAADISATERRAMAAERDTIDRLIAHFMADQVGSTFTGRIAGVNKAGLFVKLSETGADGFIPAATLGREYYYFDDANHALVAEKSGETYQLGLDVEVKLVEAAPVAGALRFEMLTKGRSGKKGGKNRKTMKKRFDGQRAPRRARRNR